MTIIDLTHPITNHMPVFESDPQVTLQSIAHPQTEGFSNYKLETGMHAGTHIDGPKHFFQNEKLLTDFQPACFIGEGYIIDTLQNTTDVIIAKINTSDLQDKIVLIYTGYYKQFNLSNYYNSYPALNADIANLLVQKQIKMIALDTPSPDYAPYELHRLFLSKNILIAENLTNMESLRKWNRFEIYALPLKTASDSAPARIIARQYQ